MKPIHLTVVVLLGGAAWLVSQPAAPERPGPRPDGSSLLVNGLVVGLLLAFSDRGPVPPAAPRRAHRLGREKA